MYRAVRYLTISPFVANPVRATAGVAAGCGFATTWGKVYTMESMLEVISDAAFHLPAQVASNVEIYIDDLQMDVEADTELEAASAFVDLAEIFRDMIKVDMCADLAYDKAAIVVAAPGRTQTEELL